VVFGNELDRRSPVSWSRSPGDPPARNASATRRRSIRCSPRSSISHTRAPGPYSSPAVWRLSSSEPSLPIVPMT
jgi:hypothetical protein